MRKSPIITAVILTGAAFATLALLTACTGRQAASPQRQATQGRTASHTAPPATPAPTFKTSWPCPPGQHPVGTDGACAPSADNPSVPPIDQLDCSMLAADGPSQDHDVNYSGCLTCVLANGHWEAIDVWNEHWYCNHRKPKCGTIYGNPCPMSTHF